MTTTAGAPVAGVSPAPPSTSPVAAVCVPVALDPAAPDVSEEPAAPDVSDDPVLEPVVSPVVPVADVPVPVPVPVLPLDALADPVPPSPPDVVPPPARTRRLC